MKRVLIVLPDGFEAFEGAAFIDVLGWANEEGAEPIEVVTAGVTSELRCTFGGFPAHGIRLSSRHRHGGTVSRRLRDRSTTERGLHEPSTTTDEQ